jgi:uncharacterized protein
MHSNKKKIINDPVHGFVRINHDIVYDLMEHPYFQRLRRIKQLGLTDLVYPGAIHTRFHHAIGAMHLMTTAIDVIRQKGHIISEEEAEAVTVAILLHDIGHGPFSHTLEKDIVTNWDHERLSLLFMYKLNDEFSGKLEMAIQIFKNEYHKQFLHQLVSSQLDMDRLDYLRRDSFFTGVSEGVIGSERIIKMLNIVDDNLVVESKGIYSIEKFLIARRLMYWQVYLHKAVLAAEKMLEMILQRAKDLVKIGANLEASPALLWFFKHENADENEIIHQFNQLDDNDIFAALKSWRNFPDSILSYLSSALLNRRLFRMNLQNEQYSQEFLDQCARKIKKQFDLSSEDVKYMLFSGQISNTAYSEMDDKIRILKKGEIFDIADASDMLSPAALSHNVIKYYLCYPKEIET